jgi:hypothetical protein
MHTSYFFTSLKRSYYYAKHCPGWSDELHQSFSYSDLGMVLPQIIHVGLYTTSDMHAVNVLEHINCAHAVHETFK